MTERFRAVVRALHERQLLVPIIGRDVLVIFYLGNSYDPWWRYTMQDNPPHLLADFSAWVEFEQFENDMD